MAEIAQGQVKLEVARAGKARVSAEWAAQRADELEFWRSRAGEPSELCSVMPHCKVAAQHRFAQLQHSAALQCCSIAPRCKAAAQ